MAAQSSDAFSDRIKIVNILTRHLAAFVNFIFAESKSIDITFR